MSSIYFGTEALYKAHVENPNTNLTEEATALILTIQTVQALSPTQKEILRNQVEVLITTAEQEPPSLTLVGHISKLSEVAAKYLINSD
ncbi:MAG: hypothetical protein SP1CHLAM54_00640 [Chlamydiia bacterium]|nr:hypothetical protein [Chlamydiia bacterium]MCH9614986.1 hypothetical protein [Chlamydiia bacterium]MCH9629964.1 hypothetical protein [Chlamydiia bacterium]